MSEDQLPPPFIVGRKYFDRDGEYTVTATAGDNVTIERPDGRRAIQNGALKAQIHRNILTEQVSAHEASRAHASRKRREPTKRRKDLLEMILQLEADGADHSGVEIDRFLVGLAQKLGYSDADVSTIHPKTGRSAFANDGDWAKAELTAEQLHEVVGTNVYWEDGRRRECNVYRLTPRGADALVKRR
jgi:hypothetical protein